MKKSFLFAMAAAALVGCSTNDLVDDSVGYTKDTQTPIGFNVQKQNITRAANLETVKHYNFGVWAWKVGGKNSLDDQEVMNHYLVGYSDNVSKGYYYDNNKTTTWAGTPGTVNDHTSPWFYEGLGFNEYEYDEGSDYKGFYRTSNESADENSTNTYKYVNYKSVNPNQYLRYWDLAYVNTNFYCYAPYNKNVKFSHPNTASATTKTTTSTMTFPATDCIRDGYDEPLNSAYNAHSRTLGEFMYAGVQSTNADLHDVTVPFKHMGAQLFIRFYEEIPGYKVEIIELCEDKGTAVANLTEAQKGIQATPAVANGTITYYTEAEAIAYNATLTGALNSTEALTAAQATAYNNAITGGNKEAGNTLSADEAAKYNATLPGAKWTGYVKSYPTFGNGTYYTTQGATVEFAESNGAATYTPWWTDATDNTISKTATNTSPLMFKIPQVTELSTKDVAPANLTPFAADKGNTTSHNVIQEKVASGAQKYSYSPTIYYPVAQPKSSDTEWKNTGLTFHVSYRIIAEDNGEVTTVHNATVHVPVKGAIKANDETNPATPSTDTDDHKDGTDYYITAWQPNVKYTYTFKITRNSTGTTNPDTAIDPTDPTPNPTVSLYPIVFDFATIDDYTTNYSEYTVSEGTAY